MVTAEYCGTARICGKNISRTKIANNCKFGEVISYDLGYRISRQNFILTKSFVRTLKKHCFHGNKAKPANLEKLSADPVKCHEIHMQSKNQGNTLNSLSFRLSTNLIIQNSLVLR